MYVFFAHVSPLFTPLIPLHSITHADKVVRNGNTEDNTADNVASKSVKFDDKVMVKSTGKGIYFLTTFLASPTDHPFTRDHHQSGQGGGHDNY